MKPARGQTEVRQEWSEILKTLEAELTEEEKTILTALAEGKSTPEISRMLGKHRSMIWRTAQRIRDRANDPPSHD